MHDTRHANDDLIAEVRARIQEILFDGNPRAVEEGIRGIIAQHPDDPRVERALVGELWDNKRRPEAEALLAEALERHPDSSELLNVAARIRLDSRDYDAAAEIARRVLAADSEDVEARIVLGQSLISLERSAQAADVLRPDAFPSTVPLAAKRLYRLAIVRKHGVWVVCAGLATWAFSEILVLAGLPIVGLAVMVLMGIAAGVSSWRIFGPKGLLRAIPWWLLLVVALYGFRYLF